MKRIIIVLATLCLSVTLYSYATAEPAAPADVINKFNTTLLESMKKADELGYTGRYKLLEPVIKESFAFPFMAHECVGAYWKNLGEKEHRMFLDEYVQWTIATYAGRFNGYSGERFEVSPEPKPAKDMMIVVSKMIQLKDDPIEFDYYLKKTDGLWRIVDIRVFGVSQLANTRAQFRGVIKNKGFNALISMLKGKISRFSRGEEK